MQKVDLIIQNAAQLLTCASPGGPKRGKALAEIGLIEDGAVAIQAGRIVAVGTSTNVRRDYKSKWVEDASGKVVCPSFVDCHTHIVYAGSRANEFELRIRGKSYMEIMQAGGGIVNTMTATRLASDTDLLITARHRLDEMLKLGTTTVEIKSGYGLDTATEIKMLETIAELARPRSHRMRVVPTFLGAHAIPPEYRGHAEEYTQLVVDEMLPAVASWFRASPFPEFKLPLFVDVFCESGAFNVEQSRRVLESGKRFGMGVKAHVDEFNSLGGVTMSIELGAISVDHLDVTGDEEITKLAQSNTIAVIMPAVNFNLGSTHFANARAMIDEGCIVALATDMNPGSAPCPSLPLVMAIACRYQKFLPAEALNACTINAAHAIGLGHGIGSIEVGKQADLLILNTDDYRELAYQFGGNPIHQVFKEGQLTVNEHGSIVHPNRWLPL